MRIEIIGLPGSGKTTLAFLIRSILSKWQLSLEQIHMLYPWVQGCLDAGQIQSAFYFEYFYRQSMYHNTTNVIMDSSIILHHLGYSAYQRDRGCLSKSQWDSLEGLYNQINASRELVSKLIVIDVDPEFALSNVAKRNRGTDAHLDIELVNFLSCTINQLNLPHIKVPYESIMDMDYLTNILETL